VPHQAVLLGVFYLCLWPLKAPGCSLREGRQASCQPADPSTPKQTQGQQNAVYSSFTATIFIRVTHKYRSHNDTTLNRKFTTWQQHWISYYYFLGGRNDRNHILRSLFATSTNQSTYIDTKDPQMSVAIKICGFTFKSNFALEKLELSAAFALQNARKNAPQIYSV